MQAALKAALTADTTVAAMDDLTAVSKVLLTVLMMAVPWALRMEQSLDAK